MKLYPKETLTPTEFKAIRKSLGLTQTKLAEAIGVHRVDVTRYETGINPISAAKSNIMRLFQQRPELVDVCTEIARRLANSAQITGSEIKAIRINLGLSQSKLARCIGLRQASISGFERDLSSPFLATRVWLTLLSERPELYNLCVDLFFQKDLISNP